MTKSMPSSWMLLIKFQLRKSSLQLSKVIKTAEEKKEEEKKKTKPFYVCLLFLSVLNEKEISVGDIVTVLVKIKVTYGQPLKEQDSEKDKENEKELEETMFEKPKRPDYNKLLPVFAPKFPELKYPCWWVILTNEKEMIIGFGNVNEYTTPETVSSPKEKKRK